MSLLEAVTQGLTGGALGAIGGALGAAGGIAEKLLTQRMANKQTRAEWEHIRQMHILQAELEAQKAQQGLELQETEGEYQGLIDSIKHDSSLKQELAIEFDSVKETLATHPRLGAAMAVVHMIAVLIQTGVNTIRALFRPFLTVYLIQLATQSDAFIALASAAVFWWIGSRGKASDPRKV